MQPIMKILLKKHIFYKYCVSLVEDSIVKCGEHFYKVKNDKLYLDSLSFFLILILV